jgi:hypothetical protein
MFMTITATGLMNNFLAQLFFIFVIVSGFLLSCGESAPPLPITSFSDVQKIQVLRAKCNSGDTEYLFSIKDRQRIEEIMTFLRENNHSWGYPFGGTAPGLPYTLHIFGEERQELVIWFGNNGLMGRTLEANDKGVRLKGLSLTEIEKLVTLVEVKEQKCHSEDN